MLPCRLGVLATPDAVVARPVAQLSIPINGKFEIVKGTWLCCFTTERLMIELIVSRVSESRCVL